MRKDKKKRKKRQMGDRMAFGKKRKELDVPETIPDLDPVKVGNAVEQPKDKEEEKTNYIQGDSFTTNSLLYYLHKQNEEVIMHLKAISEEMKAHTELLKKAVE